MLLKNVLDKPVKIKFIKSQPLSDHLFNILCDKKGSTGHKKHFSSCLKKSNSTFELRTELAAFFVAHFYLEEELDLFFLEHHFCLKGLLSHYVYSDLSIRCTFSQKMK